MIFTYKTKQFHIEGVSQEDHIFKNISDTKSFYELDLLKYMHKILRHDKTDPTVIIDVGANIGNHSIFMQCFLSDFIISIEPNPAVTPVLRKNLSRNVTGYEVFECAVGKVESTANISVPDQVKNNIGMAKVNFGGLGDRIAVTTLDSLFNKWKKNHINPCRVSAIKIDVEGMELGVLQGAKEIIATHKPNIFVEAATIQEFEILNDYLDQFGYKMLSKWAVTPVYHFCFKPTYKQIIIVRYAQLQHLLHGLKLRLASTLLSIKL